jgi:hypothetical protein
VCVYRLLTAKTDKNTNSGRKNRNCGEVKSSIVKWKARIRNNILYLICFLNLIINNPKINKISIPKLKKRLIPSRFNHDFKLIDNEGL